MTGTALVAWPLRYFGAACSLKAQRRRRYYTGEVADWSHGLLTLMTAAAQPSGAISAPRIRSLIAALARIADDFARCRFVYERLPMKVILRLRADLVRAR